MKRFGARFSGALRAGSITLLLGLLCTAALAAPRLSTVQDFAHTHPHGTPHHLHPLHLLLGGTPPSAPIVSTFFLQQDYALPIYRDLYVLAETFTSSRSRAPPHNV